MGALAVQGCVCPQATEGDGPSFSFSSLRLFYLTIVLCFAGRDLLFHKFGWKGEFGRALGCREGFMAALAAPCSPCRAGAPAEMPRGRRRRRWRREPVLASIRGMGIPASTRSGEHGGWGKQDEEGNLWFTRGSAVTMGWECQGRGGTPMPGWR